MIGELEAGDWITPRKGGRLYRVMSVDVDGAVKLGRYPLTDGVTIYRPFMPTLTNNWRHVNSSDWIRERAAHPEVRHTRRLRDSENMG